MKKRILALALAGTTAFSVFGGLNVFANSVNEFFDETYIDYAPVALVDNSGSWVQSTGYLQVTGLDGVTGDVNTAEEMEIFIEAVSEEGTSTTIAANTIYLYDYAKKGSGDTTKGFRDAYFAAVDAFRDADPDDCDAEIKAVATAFDAWIGALDTGAYANDASDRDKVINAFNENKAAWNDLDPDDYDSTAWYTTYDMDAFGVTNAPFDEDGTADVATMNTSYMVYVNQQYAGRKAAIDEAGMDDLITTYDRLLSRVQALDMTDYSRTNQNEINKYIANAEAYAEDGKWSKANAELKDALAVLPEKATYTDLRDVLMAMYQDPKGKTKESYIKRTYVGDTNAIYEAADYKVNGKQTQAWKNLFVDEFEYDVDRDGFEESYNGVYEFAYEVYYNARRSVRVGQSVVEYATEVLTDAVAALDPSTSAPEWDLLKLEKAVDIASGLVETDFVTSSRLYKAVMSALENAEEVLSNEKSSKTEVKKAYASLAAALADLDDSSAVRGVPYNLTKELRDLAKEAKDLYDYAIGEKITGAQVITLKNAYEKYISGNYGTFFDVENTTANYDILISDAEEMIAELTNAIAGFNHPQGWYQNENGTWFYGVGTENYTGWLELNGRTYFLKDDGSMAASTWVKTEKGYWYYLNASGAMLHDGWAKINDTWYFFKNFGGMAEGWVKDGNTWYYLTPGSGAMVSNGWSLINGKYYYFTESGAMLANTTTPDGYKVDASGAWVK